MKTLALATATLLLGLQTPAFADWTYYNTDSGGIGIWAPDRADVYEIDIGCTAGSHELKFGLFVPDSDAGRLADDVTIPILVVVDGKVFGPINAAIEHATDGTAVFAAWQYDDSTVGDIVLAMLASTDRTRLEFLGKSAVFDVADLDGVRDRVRNECKTGAGA